MADLCHENDALVIFDEVQTGVGMTGTMWAYQQMGVVPDIVVFGKKTQVCGIMAGRRLDDVADNVFTVSSRLNSTWGGNLTDMVRARRVFEVIERDRLVDRARLTGAHLLSALRHEPLTSVMDRAVSRLPATAPRVAILNHPGWRRFHTLPVVDGGGLLVGAITHSTVHAMLEEEALGRSTRAETVTTVFALGELYWLGLSGVLDGVASAVRGLAPPTARGREASDGGH